MTPGQSETFGGTVSLLAGDTLTFAVNNDGKYNFDLTGLTATIRSSIPEPSTWAMMLLGFAGLGFAGYRRAKSRGPMSDLAA